MSRIILYASLCLQSVPVLHREITLPALIILGKITAFKVLKFSFLIFSFPTLRLALMEMTLSLVNVSAILLKKIYQQFFPPISYFLFSKIVISIHHNPIVIILLILAQIPNCTVSYGQNGPLALILEIIGSATLFRKYLGKYHFLWYSSSPSSSTPFFSSTWHLTIFVWNLKN